jgi:hypothetical protein
MNIVLVCINNFQEYILDNITQLIKLQHENIYVITNPQFFPAFDRFSGKVKLVNIDELPDTFNFYSKTSLDKSFRNGFWTLTSLRFFYIYEFMNKYNIKDVIHLENDVLVYYNCNNILGKFNKEFVYLPFDTFRRNIASIMYIPSSEVFKIVLDNYDFSKNDMENFCNIKNKTGIIRTLPIFPNAGYITKNEEVSFVSQSYTDFNCIFDAAAMGQYLGGVDPRNNPNNTVGFINETCVIKYNNYEFVWIKTDNIKRPFLKVNGYLVSIFNLHIHHKNLRNFI